MQAADFPGQAWNAAAPSWDALPVMVVEFSRAGDLRSCNALFQATVGLTARELAGSGWQAVVNAADAQALIQHAVNPQPFALQIQLRSRAGLSLWVDCIGAPSQTGALCVLHDISSGKIAELSARAQAEQFRLLADNVPVQIAYYEAAGFRCLFANQQYANFFGQSPHDVLGKTFAQVIGAEAAAQIDPYVQQMLASKIAVTYERHLVTPQGERWIEVNLLPHLDAAGHPMAAFVLIVDLTRRELSARRVRESEERLNKFMAASEEGIVFHKDGIITDVNPPLLRLLDYELHEIIGRTNLEFIAPDERANVQAVAASRAEIAYESALLHKNGERIAVEFIVRTMFHKGQTQRMTIVRDIRDRLHARERITFLAHHDPLTGLPNRTSFMEKLRALIAQAQHDGTSLALLFIDLDHFKRVNDSLGHVVGDALLTTIASRITSGLRSTDLIARFGGDEFMVVLPDAQLRSDIDEVAGKLLQLIEVPVEIDGRSIGVTPSLGVAVFPDHGQTPEDMIKHADAAMYLAKSRGRANYQFFSEDLAKAAYEAIVLEGQLNDAVLKQQFELYFQPQVRCDDGTVSGAEALLRWRHPERGLITPDEFIPLAEQRRVMLPIGRWVLQEAARWASAMRRKGYGPLPVAVNLSNQQFHSPDFIDALAAILRDTALPGQLLELEITERMLMDDLPQIRRALSQIKWLGIKVSIDDFGTGFSSLGRLKDLPIDRLKIDRSFVKDLPSDRGSIAMAQAVVNVGHSLGLAVIAEGVETSAQAHALAELGCDEMQGYAIARPLPAADFERWLISYRSGA
jgi:diguanylate cyclase (GGDEF)-like protein/PAS domain S-box-containing protein